MFTPDGQPRTGTPTIVFRLFGQETGGTELWSESIANVPLTNGFYTLPLGLNGTPALEGVVVASDSLWMELTVDDQPMLPRQPLTTVPIAMKTANLKGGSVEATSVTVAGKPIVLKVAGKEPDPNTGNVALSRDGAELSACTVGGQTLESNGLGSLECAVDDDAQTLTVTGNAVAISNGNSASLPPATASALGVVRAGSGLSVDANGLLMSSPSVSLSGPNLTVGGTTVDLASIYTSMCPSGYVFETTCVDRNECLTNNGGCDANADCTNTVGSRTCACKAGYSGSGTTCVVADPCLMNNGGCPAYRTCTNMGGSPICATVSGTLVTKTIASKTFEFSVVAAGAFMMGATSGEGGASFELPRHSVIITKDFLLLRSETTQEQYAAVMGSNPSFFTGDTSLPVEKVSWTNAAAFCDKLSLADNVPVGTYRLPTEAEWEFAARAGTTTLRYGDINAIAWYSSNGASKTHPVKQKDPNSWNLYDMLGNVWEWVADSRRTYGSGEVTDPVGDLTISTRVYRGSSWGSVTVRAAERGRTGMTEAAANNQCGFRPARSLP